MLFRIKFWASNKTGVRLYFREVIRADSLFSAQFNVSFAHSCAILWPKSQASVCVDILEIESRKGATDTETYQSVWHGPNFEEYQRR